MHVEIEVMVRVEINVVLVGEEIRLFHLPEEGANGNVIHHEFEVVEFFDRQA